MRKYLWTFAVLVALRLFIFGEPPAPQQAPLTMSVSVTLVQHVDVFQSAAQAYTLTQTPAPSTRPQVFVNGILMCDVCGNDYSLAGTTLTFTGQQTAQMDTPVIQVWYWAMN